MRAWGVRAVSLLVLISLASAASAAASSAPWPTIARAQRTFDFRDAKHANVSLALKDTGGRAVYRLQCHTWRFEGDPEFDYSGDFECRLMSLYSKEAYSTLLTDDPNQSRDWQSRARIFAQELVGDCANYLEYGRMRNFRLRGMQIRFEFLNVKVIHSTDSATRGPIALKSFRFIVSAWPDPSVRSAIAETVNVPKPPVECGPGYRGPD